MAMRPPLLSEYDPLLEGEGSIDPMGLGAAYERLADRLLPAVTVRMGRPRFVTALAIGAHVCQEWSAETLAADGVTPAWLVYEWYVVEAFVRESGELAEGQRIPGVLKATAALRNQRPICASSYLKTPKVFGFTGIFRRLARHLRVLTEDGRLDDAGYELVGAWSRDQGLAGFIDGRQCPGSDLRSRLRQAVAAGMESGWTTAQPKKFWTEIAARLDPSKPGDRERSVLLQAIGDRAGPANTMRQLIAALTARRVPLEFEEESHFVRDLAKTADAELLPLITAILAFERYSRILLDGFDWIRHISSSSLGTLIGPKEFAGEDRHHCLRDLPDAIRAMRAHPSLLEWEPELEKTLIRFQDIRTPADLYDNLLEHHDSVQRDKPPNGKRSWFEREDRGNRVLVRPDYLLAEAPVARSEHVHDYRVPTLSRFLKDLGAFQ